MGGTVAHGTSFFRKRFSFQRSIGSIRFPRRIARSDACGSIKWVVGSRTPDSFITSPIGNSI
jgi:hypothetical protein